MDAEAMTRRSFLAAATGSIVAKPVQAYSCRQLDVVAICRIYRVPLALIQGLRPEIGVGHFISQRLKYFA